MNTYTRGIVYTLLSAIIFGFTPTLVQITYHEGANAITMTFLRAWLALPLLYYFTKRQHISLKLDSAQIKDILLLGIIGSSATTLCLYMSYNFISVGTATTLHFIYPLFVNLAYGFFYHQQLHLSQWISLILGIIGIASFMDSNITNGSIGILLALLSGFFYAFHILYLSISGIQEMHFFKLSFYLCLIMGAVCGIIGLITKTLSLHLTLSGGSLSIIISCLVSAGAISLLQLGIRLSGPCAASILSTLEPITSIFFGVLILKEEITIFKIIGCLLILISIIFTALHTDSKT